MPRTYVLNQSKYLRCLKCRHNSVDSSIADYERRCFHHVIYFARNSNRNNKEGDVNIIDRINLTVICDLKGTQWTAYVTDAARMKLISHLSSRMAVRV